MNFIKDIFKFINYLSFVDIIFFTAIITLLILLVTLIYFIKINRDVLGEDDFFPPSDGYDDKKEDIVDKIEQSMEESTQNGEEIEEYNDEEGELLDLQSLTEKLKNEEKNTEKSISKYEQDQEEKAIISYDELLKKHNRYAINYEKEEVMDDLIVKKVNLNNLINKDEEEKREKVVVISYEKEEAFLSALKELNKLLN